MAGNQEPCRLKDRSSEETEISILRMMRDIQMDTIKNGKKIHLKEMELMKSVKEDIF